MRSRPESGSGGAEGGAEESWGEASGGADDAEDAEEGSEADVVRGCGCAAVGGDGGGDAIGRRALLPSAKSGSEGSRSAEPSPAEEAMVESCCGSGGGAPSSGSASAAGDGLGAAPAPSALAAVVAPASVAALTAAGARAAAVAPAPSSLPAMAAPPPPPPPSSAEADPSLRTSRERRSVIARAAIELYGMNVSTPLPSSSREAREAAVEVAAAPEAIASAEAGALSRAPGRSLPKPPTELDAANETLGLGTLSHEAQPEERIEVSGGWGVAQGGRAEREAAAEEVAADATAAPGGGGDASGACSAIRSLLHASDGVWLEEASEGARRPLRATALASAAMVPAARALLATKVGVPWWAPLRASAVGAVAGGPTKGRAAAAGKRDAARSARRGVELGAVDVGDAGWKLAQSSAGMRSSSSMKSEPAHEGRRAGVWRAGGRCSAGQPETHSPGG